MRGLVLSIYKEKQENKKYFLQWCLILSFSFVIYMTAKRDMSVPDKEDGQSRFAIRSGKEVIKVQGPIKIIALINRKNEAYLLRTRSMRPSTVIRRHLRGEYSLTRAYFAKEGIRRPIAYLLAILDMPYYTSYQYLLACIRVLRDAGYKLVNHPNTMKNAQDLYPATKEICDYLQREPIGTLLRNTELEKYTDADYSPQMEKQKAKIRKDHKLTIRVTKADKDRFDDYAKKLNLSQGDALSVLLTKNENNFDDWINWDSDRYVGLVLQNARDQVKQMKVQFDLKERTWARERKRYQSRIETLKQKLDRIRKVLWEYYSYYQSSWRIPLEIETGDYQQYISNLAEGCQYEYPSDEGCCLVRPVAVLHGSARTPVQFVLGTTTDGRNIKLRIYHKDYFAGLSLTNETYGLRGSVWLVAWEQANDGAMDLIMALPMDLKPRYNIPWNQTNDFTRFMADLDEELAESGDKQ